MSGKLGRPKGSKDSKARSSGRWSEQTRQKHGAPPAVKAPVLPKHSIAAALAGAARRTNGAAAAQSTAPSRDPAGAPPPAGDQGERAAGSGRVDDESEGEAAAEPPDDEPEEEEPPERAAAGDEPGASPRAGVDVTDLDDELGLRAADVRSGVNFRYLRVIRDRLASELSNRWKAFNKQHLLEHLRKHDFWLRAAAAPAILQ